MVGLKDDLRTMAVTMEADMQRLLGALSAAAALRGRGARLARLAGLSQSPLWSGARRQTRAAQSVPRLRASSRPRGDLRVSRRCRCRAPSRKSTALRVSD